MSGGSLDYVSFKLDEIIEKIPDKELKALTKDFSSLLHELEWYLSGDTDKEQYRQEAIKFKAKWFGKRDERLREIICEECAKLKGELLEMIG